MVLKYLIKKKKKNRIQSVNLRSIEKLNKIQWWFEISDIKWDSKIDLQHRIFKILFDRNIFTFLNSKRDPNYKSIYSIKIPLSEYSQHYAILLSTPHYLTNAAQIPGTEWLSNNYQIHQGRPYHFWERPSRSFFKPFPKIVVFESFHKFPFVDPSETCTSNLCIVSQTIIESESNRIPSVKID